MRTLAVRIAVGMVMMFGVLALVAAPAQADPGGPFQPGDNRISPLTGDRVAIYCNADNVDVWGLNGDNQGFPLTTFSLAELTSKQTVTHTTPQGAVTLHYDAAAVTHYGYADSASTTLSLITDSGTQYDVFWSGANFDKPFSCTY